MHKHSRNYIKKNRLKKFCQNLQVYILKINHFSKIQELYCLIKEGLLKLKGISKKHQRLIQKVLQSVINMPMHYFKETSIKKHRNIFKKHFRLIQNLNKFFSTIANFQQLNLEEEVKHFKCSKKQHKNMILTQLPLSKWEYFSGIKKKDIERQKIISRKVTNSNLLHIN